ncbi:MAG: MFS transporter [Gammaproteobacteria bacterium]|nr:MFS transporter [Gammaproteobacteria bacterium]
MVLKVRTAARAWLMVVMGAIVINIGGLGVVSIGVMVPSVMTTFEANLSVVALASSITLIIGGVAAPIVGRLLDLWSVRRILTAGAVVTTIGNLIVYFSTSVWIFNAGYFVVGLGVACLAPMVIVKLLKYWFDDKLGVATGFATLPISVVLAPLAANAIVGAHGWRGVYLTFSVLAAITCVIVQFATQQAEGHSTGDRQEATQAGDIENINLLDAYRAVLASTWFWVVTLSMAILSAGSVVLLTHMVVFGADLGLENLQSVSLLSLFGLATLPGGPVFGWMTDRFGPAVGFLIIGICVAVCFLFFLGAPAFPTLVILMVVLGLCGGGFFVVFSGHLSALLDERIFGSGIGIATMIMMVVAAAAAPIAGYVHDLTGSFNVYFAVHIALAGAVAASMVVMMRTQAKP